MVVINHTLLFMLLGSPEEQEEREEGYLFPNDFIIFDEAHTVEQMASRQIGIGISQYGLRATIQRLYNARSKKGLFTVTRDAAGVTLAASLVDEADRFFAAIDERANFKKDGREYRVREADFVDDQITGRLAALQVRIGEVVRKTEDELLKAELQELGRRIGEAREGISVFLQQSAEEYVYWIERTGKTARNITLNAAPIDVAPVLRRMLFRDDCTSVMTSATLAVGRPDLAYFRRRIGADDAEPLQLGSPFDFQKQMKLFVVRKMPDPRDAGYSAALAEWVARFVEDTEGRAFVLFTSYRSMQQLALEMEEFFRQAKNESARPGQRRAAQPAPGAIQEDAAQRALRDRQFLDGRGRAGRGALQCHHHAAPICGPGSSFDRSEARTHPGTRRGCLYRILAPGSNPEIPPGGRALDSDQERQRHHRHPRQSGRDEDIRPGLLKSIAGMPGKDLVKHRVVERDSVEPGREHRSEKTSSPGST